MLIQLFQSMNALNIMQSAYAESGLSCGGKYRGWLKHATKSEFREDKTCLVVVGGCQVGHQ